MSKKILLTGGCGFVGANLVPLLLSNGHDVTIFDNLSRGSLGHLGETKGYHFIEGDICDEKAIEEAAIGKDAVIHLAAYGSVVESLESPEENFSNNVQGTFNVLNATRKANIGQLIFSSTGGALIGDATPPVDEKSVPRPISPYGASKLACEGYCCAFSNAYDISITALRFANVVGPVSWHKKGAVTAFFKAIHAGEPIHIYGTGEATRDFLYVDDLCQGILSALEKKKPGFNAYHLAKGREVSVKELAEIACKVAGVENHEIIFHPKRKGEVERNFANFDLARKELDFNPSVDIENAMKQTWEWFQTQFPDD